MIVHPMWDSGDRPPIVLWMHGRTANKELDPGRYMRWMRAGLGACAVDLPGHGERLDEALQRADRSFDVVAQMLDEIDDIIESLRALGQFDMKRVAIGGMSAGGMATLARLCRPHDFACASVEATTGSWRHQLHREMFRGRPDSEIESIDPIRNLHDWREIPLQAIHAMHDEWVPIEGQREFISALRSRYEQPDKVEFIEYERTGAPAEHIGFGRMAADAKDRQRDFLQRWLRTHATADEQG
jgi:dienelactone hydrolase